MKRLWKNMVKFSSNYSRMRNEIKCGWNKFRKKNIGDISVRLINEKDRQSAASMWKQGFPELHEGTFGAVHNPEEYDGFIHGKQNYTRMFIVENHNGIPLGAVLLSLDQLNRSVDFTLVVVLPKARGKGVLKTVFGVLLRYVEECGVDLVTCEAATFHTATQKVLRSLGFQCVGIIPGRICAWAGEGMYRRDSTRLYYMLLNGADRLVPPVCIV
jgi:RimJ/RimL family protein N-acetyltransferase